MSVENGGWGEMKKLIEYRLDRYEGRLDTTDQKLNAMAIQLTRLDERTGRKAALVGAVMGFLAGLTAWFK